MDNPFDDSLQEEESSTEHVQIQANNENNIVLIHPDEVFNIDEEILHMDDKLRVARLLFEKSKNEAVEYLKLECFRNKAMLSQISPPLVSLTLPFLCKNILLLRATIASNANINANG